MTISRTAVMQRLAVARGETRMALAGAPEFAWRLLGIAAWCLLAILMGSIVGFAAVALPPMGLAGIVAVFALVLLWILPDGLTPPEHFIRIPLFAAIAVDLSIPVYYTVQAPGLPWISARRLFTFVLIVIFSVSYATSIDSRRLIADVLKTNRLISLGAGGLIIMIFLSTFTSISPLQSASSMIGVILEWMVPFVATLYVIRSDRDVDKLIRLICWCAIVVSALGIVEFVIHHRPYLYLIPKSILMQIVSSNESFMILINESIRNGQYRASSLFIVPLSFAEYEAMVAPFGALFLLHGGTLKDRLFGFVVLILCIAGIFVSGSRGGYLSLLVAAVVFFVLFVMRSRLFEPHRMIAPIFGVIGVAGFGLVISAILFIGRVNRIIFGGGQGALSDQGRRIQWTLAWPKILANPFTGHGFAQSGTIVGYYPAAGGPPSVDSYLLTLLVETGAPSVIFFFGIALVAAWIGARQYLRDRTWAGTLAGGLACSIVAFTFYRFFLSQRENQTLFFILIACVMLLHYYFVQSKAQRNMTGVRATLSATRGGRAAP